MAIILYWKKGTTVGAWVALLVGSTLSVSGIVLKQINDDFPLNGMQTSFFSTLIAIALYVVVSLLTCRKNFDMDRMLHRGEFAVVLPGREKVEIPAGSRRWTVGRIIGFDENFTRGDKWIAGGLFWWSMLWFTIFLVGAVWNLVAPWPESAWSTYWHVAGIGVPVFIAFVTAIWFTWGGIVDLRSLFARLRAQKINDLDDGTVIGHQNQDDRAAMGRIDPSH